ncbi:HAD-IA family hydrolase [Desulfolucanica intricata]|uniref:HAD-IA family hydrolase n=1 Tax=Desulfolucanica intricata TaxID=1285191 RepID=UPI000832F582|nr:HAD-IA family hydrolase [Desulfolucanica intricata]
MTIEYLLFDLDGTLINSLPLIEKTFKRVFTTMNIPWNNGEVLKTVGLPLRQVSREYAGEKELEFFNLYQEYQREDHDQLIKIYPGTIETLRELRNRKYSLGIVTSKRRALVDEELNFTGLNELIQISVTVNDAEKPKPEPDPVLKALQLFNITPEQAIYIGDSWYDILSGQRAGVKTVGVTWGMAKREELMEYKPDIIVDSWDEILSIFK